jgi:uncharacterized protein YjbI with pentapeptide repeats
MAEEEQLKILKQGVKAWNSWSKRHITTSIDLSGADLSEVNLSKVDLSEANLFGANLVGTDFRAADLSAADLRWTNLSEANLSNANLFEANLSGAGIIKTNLSMANLSWACLNEANLSKANLSEANLTQLTLLGTEIDGALFVNVDLSAVRGLQHCYHFGPSSIDHRTLSKSGQLPIEFLRGCGLSDWEIETTRLYNLALTLEDFLDIQRRVFSMRSTRPASQFYPLFISYSSEDEKIAKMVQRSLQASGVRCWLARNDRNTGCRFQQPVDEMLQIHGRVVLIISKNSIMSPWIRNEIEAGLAKERKEDREVLFPIKIDSAYKQDKLDWPVAMHREIHLADFSEWRNQDAYNEAFNNILKTLTG